MRVFAAFGPKFRRRGWVMLTFQDVSNSRVGAKIVEAVLSNASRSISYLPPVRSGSTNAAKKSCVLLDFTNADGDGRCVLLLLAVPLKSGSKLDSATMTWASLRSGS